MKRNAFRIIYLVVALLCALVCLTSCKANPENTSSGTEASAVNDIFQVENTVSEAENTSSVEETISKPEEVVSESAQVQDNSATASQTTTKKQTNTQTSKAQTTQPKQATQSEQTKQQQVPAWDGNENHDDPNWTCPNPNAHTGANCINSLEHDRLIKARQEEQELLKQLAAKWGLTVDEYKVWKQTHCTKCGKVIGDGHNGTCYNYFENGVWTCHTYD